MELTTCYQDFILSTISKGGKLTCWWVESNNIRTCGYHYSFQDKNGNDMLIRSDSVKRLSRLRFIVRKSDHPAIGVNTYFLTTAGRDWVKVNKQS